MLSHILNSDEYALCLTPGFFRFYAHIGILHALEETNLLKPKYVTGSSAGALVGAFLSAGRMPSHMIEAIMPMERKDFWDMGGVGGLLKGNLFQNAIEKHLPVQTIEECPIPFACTAYDTIRFKTKKITSGSIATAARASCTFPGLFQPVIIDGTPHIDGGVWDWTGLMSLDECILADARRKSSTADEKLDLETLFPRNKLVVNVCYDTDFGSKLPAGLAHARLLTIVVENIPPVTPFTMGKMGIEAYKLAKAAMHRALFSCHIQELSANHWCCYVDGKLVNQIPPEIRNSLPVPQVSIDEPFTPRSLPSISGNISQRNSQQQLMLPSSGKGSAPMTTLIRTTSQVTTASSEHDLAESALFRSHTDEGTLDGTEEDDNNNKAAEEEENEPLIPSMPGVNLLPSFHLPHLPEHLGDFVHLPSYPFINGTYFYEAFHHTTQNASDTLHQTLHAMNTTMSATLDSLLELSGSRVGTKRRRDDEGEEDSHSEEVSYVTSENTENRPAKVARVNNSDAEETQGFQLAHTQCEDDDDNELPSTQPKEELMDYVTSQTQVSSQPTVTTQTDHANAHYHLHQQASPPQEYYPVPIMGELHRDSEDLDDALAILDAVDFMVSSHNNHTQHSPQPLPNNMPGRPSSASQQSTVDDPLEMFAAAIDVEVATGSSTNINL